MKSFLMTGLFAGFVLALFSFTLFPYSISGAENTSDLTGFDKNNTMRNLTNPVLKMERNPLADISNPLANLSNPIANMS